MKFFMELALEMGFSKVLLSIVKDGVMQKTIFCCVLFLTGSFACAQDACFPAVVSSEGPHFLIGYGSLIEKESRLRTNPDAIDSYPVKLNGYKRVWGARGQVYKAVFLTLLKDDKSSLNAVYYAASREDFLAADKREYMYCRTRVQPEHIKAMGLKKLHKGTFWVYVKKDNKATELSAEYPIVQSYVDIFLDGCLQIQKIYGINDFAEQCINTTHGWPAKEQETKLWINDREYARRPFQVPHVLEIDKLLSEHFSDYYKHPYG